MAKNHWPEYRPQSIEGKWQEAWEREGLYRAAEGEEAPGKPKFYCLDFFPYPSGDGLHVGHCRNYVPTDVLSRYKRMRGFNVLHPMGWDAFGEPTEQAAVRHNLSPRQTTDLNTANFRRQMTLIGTSYDWSREIDSSKPEFYRWTQYFFLLLYRRGLAYRDTNWQWWCPTCMTTLSSHEVDGGKCWRGHEGVHRREIPAWYFRITAYADELISGLETVDWPEPIKAMQRNWIGRSEGCEIVFRNEAGEKLPVFTTRPDTLFGATFFALAPEHPLLERLTTTELKLKVQAYIRQAAKRSELDRLAEARERTGVFTGAWVLNPLSGERIPVWTADYVLPGYGTGAVMGVPAHDKRDLEFARKFDLPVRVVVAAQAGLTGSSVPELADAYTGEGRLVNSGEYDGMESAEARRRIAKDLERAGLGGVQVRYRMRDWLISRQRYWGASIPIVQCAECGIQPMSEEQLPVELPPMADFQPDGSGRSPLGRVPEFVHTSCPRCGGPAERETDTMGGFACSSWYFLRFASPNYEKGPFDPQALRYWLPVDLYVGGAEHAVLHLLYSRFWVKVMADAGLVPFREPFSKLLNQGQLLGPDGVRMSKSRGNVIIPDDVAERHGADTLRVYEMFMAPFDQDIAWSEQGLVGARRFLERTWKLCGEAFAASASASGTDAALERSLHATIRKVSERIESFRFNTMVSALMEFSNLLVERRQGGKWQTATYHHALETLILLLAPTAPHFSEELWHLIGKVGSVHQQEWPVWDPDLAREEVVEIAVQVNGRLRAVIEVTGDATQDEALGSAMALPKVQQHLNGRTPGRVYYVAGKVINIISG